MDSVTCAVCGGSVPLDQDHARVNVETVRTRDRNDVDDYVLHDLCALAVFEGWSSPA
jgi:hypothetical protein